MDWGDWNAGSDYSGDNGYQTGDYFDMPLYEGGDMAQAPFAAEATQMLQGMGAGSGGGEPNSFAFSPYPQLGGGGFQPNQQPLGQPPQQINPWAAAIGGSLPGIGGLLGQLIGGTTATRSQQLPVAQRAAYNQGQGILSQYGPQFAAGQTQLQQMQLRLLQALESGQGLPTDYQKLIEQAYHPALGDLYSQATEQGRQRGFYDAPAQSPAGSAIMGPGLAALQGQQAASKLGLMQSLPGLFNQPIQQQGNFAAQFGQGLMNQPGYAWNQESTPAWGSVIGQSIQQSLGGAGQGYGIADLYNWMKTRPQQGQQQQPNYSFASQYPLSQAPA